MEKYVLEHTFEHTTIVVEQLLFLVVERRDKHGYEILGDPNYDGAMSALKAKLAMVKAAYIKHSSLPSAQDDSDSLPAQNHLA